MYNEIRVFVENRPGKLGRVADLLGSAGINILAMELADEGQFGVLKMLTAEPEKAKRVLTEANIAVAFNPVAVIEIPDQPGSLVKLSRAIEGANLNVSDAYGCILERGKRAIFVVKGDKLDVIEAAAVKAGLRALSSLD